MMVILLTLKLGELGIEEEDDEEELGFLFPFPLQTVKEEREIEHVCALCFGVCLLAAHRRNKERPK